MSTPARLTSLGLLAALLTASGCGPANATAAGKVTHQGKPVVVGTVTLLAADGTVHQVGLAPDGSFRLANVPTGPAKVGVYSPAPPPANRPPKGRERDERSPIAPPTSPPAGWFPLPDKFADPEKSGVTVNVTGGSADIDLK